MHNYYRQHKHYRMTDGKKGLLIFELGNVWYFIDENQNVLALLVQDIQQLIDTQSIQRAIASEDELRLINKFFLSTIFVPNPDVEPYEEIDSLPTARPPIVLVKKQSNNLSKY